MTGKDIRAFRVEFGMSQGVLARALGVARGRIIALEAGTAAAPYWLGLALAALKADLPPFTGQPEIVTEIGARRDRRVSGPVVRREQFADL